MKANNTYTIFITPLKGNEIRIEKACTLKQAVTLAKKEARKALNNGGMLVFINIQTRGIYNTIETLAHIEAEKEGRRVIFSDEQPAAETYAVCWGVEYSEEEGESNAIAETRDEADAKEFAENESKDNNCRMCVVRKSDNKVIAIYDNTTPETTDTMNTDTKTMNEENEALARLKSELQEYYNNASKGGADRAKNMRWLQEDIKKLEQKKRRNELQAMADSRREYGQHPASDPALIVLLLMETEEHANNYCAALREVLAAFPEIDRDELENELNRFI